VIHPTAGPILFGVEIAGTVTFWIARYVLGERITWRYALTVLWWIYVMGVICQVVEAFIVTSAGRLMEGKAFDINKTPMRAGFPKPPKADPTCSRCGGDITPLDEIAVRAKALIKELKAKPAPDPKDKDMVMIAQVAIHFMKEHPEPNPGAWA